MEESDIQKGVPVIRRSTPATLGILTGRIQRLGPVIMAQVKWGANTQYEDVRYLRIADLDEDREMDATVERGEYGTIEDLRRRITYEKLQGTLTDVFYSMKTARIDFLPHQFKPVLRFIDSPTNRLLLADEVGLGKTIEAGLIWTEWQARHGARRLLVVCPPSLCPKWERELCDRFLLPAQIVNRDGVSRLLERYLREGPLLRFVAIASYDALSPRKLRTTSRGHALNEKELLDSLVDPPSYGRTLVPDLDQLGKSARILYRLLQDDDCADFLDMVIFDEAHRMKNTATVYHTLGNVLSCVGGAALCLSATPIHNRNRDLYALLRLVDPDYFRGEYMFSELVNRNLPVVQFLNKVGAPSPSQQELLELSSLISASPYFRKSRVAQQVAILTRQFDGGPASSVALFRAAEKLNLLGSYLNRTRKAQVQERRVQRNPVVWEAPMSPVEQGFYKAVLRQVRAHVKNQGEQVTAFHLIAPALRMASCMPTVIPCLDSGRWGGWEELVEFGSDFDNPFALDSVQPPKLDLSEFRHYDFEANDSKYEKLRDNLIHQLDDRKVLIFAFFKDTIRYLERRLNADGVPARSVTGDIADRILRDRLMQEFETDDNRVLLLSEIGAEGVDLQFCRAMVNYDLPWNPMRLEQRIGRIDRIGQQAKSITIVNFHIPDTIDGRILTCLYAKIGVFRNTIGDLEGILGQHISRLTADLLRDDLTPEQELRLIGNTAKAIEERRKTESDLEASSGALVAFTDYLAESIGESQRMGRFIRPEELRIYVQDFLSQIGEGSHMDWDSPYPRCAKIRLAFKAWEVFQDYLKSSQEPPSPGLGRGSRSATITFEPTVYEKYRRQCRSLVLVNHLNPFIKWITHENQRGERRLHSSCAVRVESDNARRGLHFFLIRRLSLTGLRKREKLYYGLQHIESREVVVGSQAEGLINECLEAGRSLFPRNIADNTHLLADLREQLAGLCRDAHGDFVAEMESKAQVLHEQAKAHFDRRLAIARARLESMRESDSGKAQGIELTERQIRSLQGRREEALRRFDAASEPEISMNDVCCGLIQVDNG